MSGARDERGHVGGRERHVVLHGEGAHLVRVARGDADEFRAGQRGDAPA